MFGKQRGLDARRIIFGKPGDLLEQLGTGAVVEPARRDRARTISQSVQHIAAERGIGGAQRIEQRGHKSLASLSPANCQR
jgi:hypothetical protein